MPGPLCSVCGKHPATYVCQTCGNPACIGCFDTTTWTCRACIMKGTAQTQDMRFNQPMQFGLASLIFLLAFAVIFIGVLLVALGSMASLGSASGGAIILIGPIPIILGSGPYSFELIEIAVVLTIVAVVLFLFVRRR